MFLVLPSALSPSLSVSDLCLLFHPAHCLTPSRTNSFKSSTFSYFPPSLSLSLPPELCQILEKKNLKQIHRGKHRKERPVCAHTHTHIDTHLLPNSIHSTFLPLSPLPLQISPDPLQTHSAEVRTGHIQLYLTWWELFRPFLLHRQALTPLPKMRHPWSAVPGLYEHKVSELSRWNVTHKKQQ